jgi:integrase
VTVERVIGLLAVTGMRIGEVIRLDLVDVDLDNGTLTIWHPNFNKNHQLPLTASTVDALRRYQRRRPRLGASPRTGGFFVSPDGDRLSYSRFHQTFIALRHAAGVPSVPWPRRSRIHDLRHAFTEA